MKVSTTATNLLREGIIYLSGRDKNLRPLIVFNTQRLFALTPFPTAEDMTSCLIVFLNFIEHKMITYGVVESYSVILDCSALGITNTPYAAMK